jgi:hypothetical protein
MGRRAGGAGRQRTIPRPSDLTDAHAHTCTDWARVHKYAAYNLYINLVSAYLNDQLRPLITDRLSEPALLGWNELSREYQHGPRWRRLAHPAGLGLLFPVPAAVALVLVVPRLSSPWAWLVWACGWLLVLAQVVLTSQRVSSVGTRRAVSHTEYQPSGE